MQITIDKIENGYLVYRPHTSAPTYCADVQTLFERLLLEFEGRSKNLGGEYFGAVFVATKSNEKFTVPTEAQPA